MVQHITLLSGKSVYAEIHRRDATQRTADIPIIFIPGFLNTTVSFTPLLPYFTDYTRILYDMDGHGHTPAHPTPVTINSLAQDIHDILAYYDYHDTAILVGHSVGAILALQYSHQFPRRVAKLVLLGPLGLPLPREQMMSDANLVRTLPMPAMVAHVSQWLGAAARADPRITGLVRAETERHGGVQEREGAARHMMAVADYEFADVGEVREKTWVVRGREDSISPESAATSVVERVPGAKVITLDRGHYFTWENLEGTVDALRSVLDE